MGILINTYVFLKISQWRGLYFSIFFPKYRLVFAPQQQHSRCSSGKVLMHGISSHKAHVFKAPDSFYVSINQTTGSPFNVP